jgi:hypothetical protein
MNLLLENKIVTDYTSEPVSVSTAKAYMKVNFSDDDTLIASLLKNATLWLENYTGLSYGVRTIMLTIEMNANEFYLLPGPVQNVCCVSIIDHVPTETDDYVVIGGQLKVYTSGIYEISLEVGYTTIPKDAENDILAITAYTYQNRGIDLSNENASLVDFPMLASAYYKRLAI